MTLDWEALSYDASVAWKSSAMLDHSVGAASAFNETTSVDAAILFGKTGLKVSNSGVLSGSTARSSVGDGLLEVSR